VFLVCVTAQDCQKPNFFYLSIYARLTLGTAVDPVAGTATASLVVVAVNAVAGCACQSRLVRGKNLKMSPSVTLDIASAMAAGRVQLSAHEQT